MFVLFALIGSIAMWTGIIMLVIAWRKKKAKKPGWIALGIGFGCMFISGAIMPPTNQPVAEEVEPAVTTEEVAEETAAVEEQPEVPPEEAAEEVDPVEKKAYVENIKPHIDRLITEYDEVWNTLWIPTFEGVADGSVDLYTAYENMIQMENAYSIIGQQINAIPSEGLSEKNKELLAEFKSKFGQLVWEQEEIAKQAQAMFDEGDFSPSAVNDIQTDIQNAQNQMYKALVPYATLEVNLGIE